MDPLVADEKLSGPAGGTRVARLRRWARNCRNLSTSTACVNAVSPPDLPDGSVNHFVERPQRRRETTLCFLESADIADNTLRVV